MPSEALLTIILGRAASGFACRIEPISTNQGSPSDIRKVARRKNMLLILPKEWLLLDSSPRLVRISMTRHGGYRAHHQVGAAAYDAVEYARKERSKCSHDADISMVLRESSRRNHSFAGGVCDSWVHVGREGQRTRRSGGARS